PWRFFDVDVSPDFAALLDGQFGGFYSFIFSSFQVRLSRHYCIQEIAQAGLLRAPLAPQSKPEPRTRLRSCAHKSATAQLSLSALCEAAEEAVVLSAAGCTNVTLII